MWDLKVIFLQMGNDLTSWFPPHWPIIKCAGPLSLLETHL